jgi:hypothetical protein
MTREITYIRAVSCMQKELQAVIDAAKAGLGDKYSASKSRAEMLKAVATKCPPQMCFDIMYGLKF